MEQDFQTSFIPKKPIVEDRATSSARIGFLTVLALFIFFTVILASGGLFFYKTVIAKNFIKKEGELNLAKNRFEPETIEHLKVLDKRLRASTEVLSKHVAVSPIFEALGDITMKTIRYTKFSYSLGEDDKDPKLTVEMSGMAVGYRSIALQSDLFAKNKYFINPIFSDLSLDASGNVLFELKFLVDPTFIDFHQVLNTKPQEEESVEVNQEEIIENGAESSEGEQAAPVAPDASNSATPPASSVPPAPAPAPAAKPATATPPVKSPASATNTNPVSPSY